MYLRPESTCETVLVLESHSMSELECSQIQLRIVPSLSHEIPVHILHKYKYKSAIKIDIKHITISIIQSLVQQS